MINFPFTYRGAAVQIVHRERVEDEHQRRDELLTLAVAMPPPPHERDNPPSVLLTYRCLARELEFTMVQILRDIDHHTRD